MRRALAGAALLTLTAAPLAAAPRIELSAGVTTASSDGPQNPGASFGAAALWNLGRNVSFGPMLLADDLGTTLGRVTDGSGTDLGPAVEQHRLAYAFAWRADMLLFRLGSWGGSGGATWGVYRIQDDQLGDVQHVESTAGWSFSGALARPLRPSTSIGLSARWHQLKTDYQNHYLRIGLDLAWQPGAGSSGASTSKPTP